MNATTKCATKRVATRKATISQADKEFAATLSPKLGRLYLKIIPLRGKFTKALAIK